MLFVKTMSVLRISSSVWTRFRFAFALKGNLFQFSFFNQIFCGQEWLVLLRSIGVRLVFSGRNVVVSSNWFKLCKRGCQFVLAFHLCQFPIRLIMCLGFRGLFYFQAVIVLEALFDSSFTVTVGLSSFSGESSIIETSGSNFAVLLEKGAGIPPLGLESARHNISLPGHLTPKKQRLPGEE